MFAAILLVAWGVGIPVVGILLTLFRKTYFVKSYVSVKTPVDATVVSFVWPVVIIFLLYIQISNPIKDMFEIGVEKLNEWWIK